jgi:high-affinity iron transporter
MRRMLLVLMLCLLGGGLVLAADENPAHAAEDIRQALFNAQVALMAGDAENAARSVEEAEAQYQAVLSPAFEAGAPDVDADLQAAFEQVGEAMQAENVAAFAAVRSQIWTGLLNGSSQIIFAAVAADDSATAALWLPLRDFRVSTRFSRPGADATLAVRALAEGTLNRDETTQAVEADLWDTYQAQLNSSLADADEAQQNGFALRRAEEAALAQGYFAILAPAYETQRSADDAETLQAQFAALVEASISGTDETFVQARTDIDTALAGFRAAPLSEEELARRAGQLMRFVALVPVEYARGVRNGVVTNDIEIQEALTFHEGAVSAFQDLQSTLTQLDAEATAQLAMLLPQTLEQIRTVAEPAELQATIDQMNTLLTQVIPEEWQTGGGASDVDVILSVLDQVEKAAAQDDYTLAESARLEAYALLELGVEQRLRGFAPELAVEIESLFWQGTTDQAGLAVLLASKAPLGDVRASLAKLETTFDEARLLLGSSQSAPAAVTGNAAVIVFREGLEAVLILASLLASLRTLEQRRFRRPLIVGSVLALGATIVTWIIATNLLNVLLPLGEKLEAIVSLIAIGVLLIITNWFFHKAYWVGWMANFHARKRELVGGVVTITISQTIGLILLGFTSIYREGFETVLFLQSLVLEAGTSVVLQGVALGLLGTAVVGVITFALQVRLPYKKMLVVTGVLIGGVLLTMVGHTVHVIQSVGWLPITPIQGVFIPYWMGQWFGLFATWQGIILQFASAAFVIGSYFLAEHQNKRTRTRAQQSGEPSQAAL